ncbi:hypothetical protein JNM05_11515 [bacterium]|nr:hypothetical protein [bacterium]
MIRIGLKIALCLLILAITHPYAFFSIAFHPLQVTIYWDEPDQDEDIFVSRVNTDDGTSSMVYQEESKRDHDQKSKLKLKIKIEYFPNQTNFISTSLVVTENGDTSFIPALQGFFTSQFHPPNLFV